MLHEGKSVVLRSVIVAQIFGVQWWPMTWQSGVHLEFMPSATEMMLDFRM